VRQKIDIMRVTETRLDKLKRQVTSLDSVATPLITAINDRSFWPEILEELMPACRKGVSGSQSFTPLPVESRLESRKNTAARARPLPCRRQLQAQSRERKCPAPVPR